MNSKTTSARIKSVIANASKAMAPTGSGPETPAPEVDTTAADAPSAAPTKKTKKAATVTSEALAAPAARKGGITFADLAERYLKHLEKIGKSRGTVFSYNLDLNVAARHFGEQREVSSITSVEVAEYFASDAIQKTRSGSPKNQITILKLERTARQMFAFAVERELIAASPVPKKPAKDEPAIDATEAVPAKVKKTKAPNAAPETPVAATSA